MKPKKRSGPQEAAGEENAKAEENGGRTAAVAKPKRTRKSTGERAAEKQEKKKEATKGARKALREEVKKAVKARCKALAQQLVQETEQGNMRSASMMFSLIEEKKDKDGKYDGPSEAELLGSEEQWQDESPLAAEARETGNREQRMASDEILTLGLKRRMRWK